MAATEQERFTKKHYAPLVGCTVVGLRFDQHEWSISGWPVLTLQTPSGRHLEVTVSTDPEGNGPGWLFIEEVQS